MGDKTNRYSRHFDPLTSMNTGYHDHMFSAKETSIRSFANDRCWSFCFFTGIFQRLMIVSLSMWVCSWATFDSSIEAEPSSEEFWRFGDERSFLKFWSSFFNSILQNPMKWRTLCRFRSGILVRMAWIERNSGIKVAKSLVFAVEERLWDYSQPHHSLSLRS